MSSLWGGGTLYLYYLPDVIVTVINQVLLTKCYNGDKPGVTYPMLLSW